MDAAQSLLVKKEGSGNLMKAVGQRGQATVNNIYKMCTRYYKGTGKA
jgi:hypothetical protein